MQDIDRIGNKATEILETIVRKFSENDVDLPERRYIAVGDIAGTAHDTEQVTVSFGSAAEGMPNNSVPNMQPCNSVWRGMFYVEVVRCTPQGNTIGARGGTPPTPEEISEYSLSRMRDSAVLVQVGEELGASLFTRTTPYTIDSGPDSGAAQAIRLNLNMVID